jgi:hypothetical protein
LIPLWFRRIIREGDVGADVKVVRRKLGLFPDGPFDRACIERIKYMTKSTMDSEVTVVDETVAEKLGESAANKAGLVPEWFERPLELHDVGEDVRALRKVLGVWDDNRYEVDCESAVRRYQSQQGKVPDGKVDEDLARSLGDV